ncbi:MAG TPA: SDR family oxidoreductase [Acidimicrobiales bacterium]|nr:SDR family oxidoreductase [Acidimicrobiales bacterium]
MARWPVALVTGASSGIGRAIAVQLAVDGSHLIVVARRRDRLEALAEELRAAHGVKVDVLVADVTVPEQLAAVEDRLRDGAAPVDLLVNNAGAGGQGAFAEIPLEWQESQIRLNVLAPVRLTHAALEQMLPRGRGGVLNVSSIAGLQPMPNVATYAATKAYLSSFSHALHEEVRHKGVSVTALLPGFTRTEFHDAGGMNRSIVPGPAWMSAEVVARSALRAVARGRAQCVPGLLYRVLTGISNVTPWSVSRRVLGAVLR